VTDRSNSRSGSRVTLMRTRDAAFCLFLVPIVLAQVLFGTKYGLAAALASQVKVH
jgi:hypothetical protein